MEILMKNSFLIRIKLSFFIAAVSVNVFYAQTELYTPLNIQKAYQKETRSFDGKPGKNYWQNSSDYKIKAEREPT